MMPSYILVPGPPVRPASWQPTAELLRQAGCSVQVPDVLAHCAPPPRWRAWTEHLLACIDAQSGAIVVAHSSACALAAELASKMAVGGLILVDGDIPPTHGFVRPVRPALLAFIAALADERGTLPVWSRWFEGDPARARLVGIDIFQRNGAAFSRFEQGLPRLRLDWFDDAIELAGWDHVPAAYIQASPIYDHATAEADRRGWPFARLHGTHLDPVLRPDVMANAIMKMTGRLEQRAASGERGGFVTHMQLIRTPPLQDRRRDAKGEAGTNLQSELGERITELARGRGLEARSAAGSLISWPSIIPMHCVTLTFGDYEIAIFADRVDLLGSGLFKRFEIDDFKDPDGLREAVLSLVGALLDMDRATLEVSIKTVVEQRPGLSIRIRNENPLPGVFAIESLCGSFPDEIDWQTIASELARQTGYAVIFVGYRSAGRRDHPEAFMAFHVPHLTDGYLEDARNRIEPVGPDGKAFKRN
ncbi:MULTISPECIES: alpha/beta hydrolase [unclassified Bradyrhizobium]|uniref:alpha/beta hydrolase n=1 Tax=unclassified Bradyrhizobium TaxID=2631580 RepID=UPI0028E96E91|nr:MULTISPECIES: alpha/beta hydrolase [unclassified Bradyrhizobium]